MPSRKSQMPGTERVTWIANFVPPYAAPMYALLNRKFMDFELLISTEMESCRPWRTDMRGINTRLQKTLTWTYTWRHPNGFSERIEMHFPYDTLPALFQRRPDVLISSELGLRTIQAVIYRLLVPVSRLVIRATVSEVSEQGRGRVRMWIRRKLLKHADAVIVNGESGVRYIRGLGVPRDKLFVTPYTTDMKPWLSISDQRCGEQATRLLYVGQLVERKGLGLFFEVLRDWASRHSERPLEMWLVGDGCLREKLERYNFPKNVALKFLGNMPYSELPAIYAQVGILVFPTLADEWGLVVNEALAAGLLVFGSTYSQAVEELVSNHVNGWTFRPNQAEMCAAFDEALRTSETVLNKMRQQGRCRIASFTPEYAADAVSQAVEHAVKTRDT
jgi:glycosyltransferase involved in cell wall biosynthesis